MCPSRPLAVFVQLTFLVLVSSVVCPFGVLAQPSGRTWIPFDDSPPGTPASLELMENDSSAQATRAQLLIHGFWLEMVQGPDQRVYSRYEFPGLDRMEGLGAPELPRFVLRLAVPTTAQEFTLRRATSVRERIYQNVLPYPAPLEGFEDSADEWRYDQSIYEGQQPHPPQVAQATQPIGTFLNNIRGGGVELFPVQWDPLTRRLRIIELLDVVYDHEGPILNREGMTRHRARLASNLFHNWLFVEDEVPVDTTRYQGDFLFVYPAVFEGTLRPLSNQKRSRGFYVTELTLEEVGNTCADVRAAIANWHATVPVWADAYAILVGDYETLPMCEPLDTAGHVVYTDDYYGSPSHNDLEEEVFVGRLSAEGFVELSRQVAKILEYEDTGDWMGDYRDVLLVAHEEDAPGRYYTNCEEIRIARYSDPPNFLTCYGSDGATNADIDLAIEGQVGVVCYRGHGSPDGWQEWNTLGESYTREDLADLGNDLVTPVVWSVTCTSGDLRAEDCFLEELMKGDRSRAVAAYGATMRSAFDANNVIARTLFEQVYDEDVVIHSHAIMVAETESALEAGSLNAYLYYLLGDPEMHIRRRAPGGAALLAPETVPVCSTPPCWLDIRVMDDQGLPLPGWIVSAWMPAPLGRASKVATLGKRQPPAGGVLCNLYSDPEGKVHLPAEPGAEGWIMVTARDDFGRVITDSVRVVAGTGTPPGLPSLMLSPRPSVMSDRTSFFFGRELESGYRLEIYDQRGRLVRRIRGERGPATVQWDGRDDEGGKVASGVYLVRLIAEQRRLSTKVVMLR